jgi:hypothetical protein
MTQPCSSFQDRAFDCVCARRVVRDEAKRWLEKLRTRVPSSDSARFWEEVEIRLLFREAEALALDNEFPTEPFTR